MTPTEQAYNTIKPAPGLFPPIDLQSTPRASERGEGAASPPDDFSFTCPICSYMITEGALLEITSYQCRRCGVVVNLEFCETGDAHFEQVPPLPESHHTRAARIIARIGFVVLCTSAGVGLATMLQLQDPLLAIPLMLLLLTNIAYCLYRLNLRQIL